MIILFDGVCNLCNGVVDFIVRKDKKQLFRFVALQSDTGKQIRKDFGIAENSLNSVVYIYQGKAFMQSEAVLNILKELGYPWKLLYGFKILPLFIRDALYRVVAENRYRIFGKKDSCRVDVKREW